MEPCNIVQEVVIKSILKRNKCDKANCLPEEGLKVAEKIRRERQRRKGETYPMECRLPENSKER